MNGWPEEWGKEHHSLCVFILHVFIKAIDSETVAVISNVGRVLGHLPRNITEHELYIAGKAMIEAYEAGFASGQAILAKKVLEPIQQAIEENMKADDISSGITENEHGN